MTRSGTPRSDSTRSTGDLLQPPAPDWGVADTDVAGYLQRLGVDAVVGETTPDLALLEEIHGAHVRALPFSNLGVLLGGHPGVDPATVSRRLVAEGTGGLCYEHVQLMGAALEALGYDVVRHLGRVHAPDNTRTHVTLEVRLDGRRWLLDPGFGLSITGPIELVDGAERVEDHGVYRLRRVGEGPATQWALLRADEPQHFTDELPGLPVDLQGVHVVVATDPSAGPFLHGPVVNRHTADGHVSITGDHRVVRRAGKETAFEELDPAGVVAAIRELGVPLSDDDAAALRDRLAAQPRG